MDKGVHTFPKGISLKVNVIERLEFGLSYNNPAVYRFNHYATTTHLVLYSVKYISKVDARSRGVLIYIYIYICVCVCVCVWSPQLRASTLLTYITEYKTRCPCGIYIYIYIYATRIHLVLYSVKCISKVDARSRGDLIYIYIYMCVCVCVR